MIYTSLTKKALDIAYEAHKDQLDRGGAPYVFHPFHLAEQMETPDEICVALLHDILEDTDITVKDLRRSGFSKEVVEAVILLTKTPRENYFSYILRIKQSDNKIAIKVKIADLTHNLDANRLSFSNNAVYERLGKYRQALAMLKENEK